MRISSFLISFLLHLAVLAFLLYVPLRPPVDLTRPVYQVSLVMGAPGGEKLPSPVLGARPPVTGKQVTSTESAPQPRAENAPAPSPTASAIPKPESLQKKTEPKPEPKPEPQPEKRPDPVHIPQKPEPKQTPKPEVKPAPKQEPKPAQKPESKPTQAKTDSSPSKNTSASNALADALADARRQTNAQGTGKSGSSASRALADLEKQVGRTGVGGGGGEGDGPGGGGIYDVYAAQVILAVQPNWSMPTYSRNNIVAQIRIKLDKQGKVLDCRVERSSGRPEFDASAVNAVIRTGTLPPPPTSAQQDLVISFNSLQMTGR